MAKRFTDTNKWEKRWFRELSVTNKCFWGYLCDRCNHIGIWEVDFVNAEFYIGQKIDRKAIENIFKKQIVKLDKGKRWFIKDFVGFQYGELNPNNPAHKNVIKTLEKYHLGDSKAPTKPLQSSLQGLKDKEKEKAMDKVKAKLCDNKNCNKQAIKTMGLYRVCSDKCYKDILEEKFGDSND